jgi:hypothetical protein
VARRALQLEVRPCAYCLTLLPRIRNPQLLYCGPDCQEAAKKDRAIARNPAYFEEKRAYHRAHAQRWRDDAKWNS